MINRPQTCLLKPTIKRFRINRCISESWLKDAGLLALKDVKAVNFIRQETPPVRAEQETDGQQQVSVSRKLKQGKSEA